MANQKHLEVLKQGVETWNRWREEHPNTLPDLRDAELAREDLSNGDFSGVRLENASLSKANLKRASFFYATLPNADLREADLLGVDFERAELIDADLTGSYLYGADLRDADLSWAILEGADMHGADLRGAVLSNALLAKADLSKSFLGRTTLGDVDLSEVQGLDTVRHTVPSTIGIDTIYRSNGNIPEIFLRGCGVPDSFIEFARSLVGRPLQYYSCFISHSSRDKGFAGRLYADLQVNGVRTWYFPEDAKWGELVWAEIDRGIRTHHKLVVICSEDSLQSGPVLREIERALQREDREGKGVLFPVRIDDYLFEEWEHERKADVLAKVVGDFRGWDTSAEKYDAAFQRLLEALQAGG